jgi:hypothetical protein
MTETGSPSTYWPCCIHCEHDDYPSNDHSVPCWTCQEVDPDA